MIYESCSPSHPQTQLTKRCVIIRRESGRVGRQSACRDRDPQTLRIIPIIRQRSGAGDQRRPRVRRGSDDAAGGAGKIGLESQVR